MSGASAKAEVVTKEEGEAEGDVEKAPTPCAAGPVVKGAANKLKVATVGDLIENGSGILKSDTARI